MKEIENLELSDVECFLFEIIQRYGQKSEHGEINIRLQLVPPSIPSEALPVRFLDIHNASNLCSL